MNNSSEYKVSLRSLGEEDTTAISKALGGGGHCNASSFTAAVHLLDSWTLLADST
jgi:nanoRNase/pAp phosphatase (c-di-AMP/oligoRNAs hydrolase)